MGYCGNKYLWACGMMALPTLAQQIFVGLKWHVPVVYDCKL